LSDDDDDDDGGGGGDDDDDDDVTVSVSGGLFREFVSLSSLIIS
jgi:hypothetical protein